MSTMEYEVVDGIIVVVQGTEAPSNDEWSSILALVDDAKRRVEGVLVVTDGGGPTAAQRVRLGTEVRSRSYKTAVVTDSRAARMIATAVSWFGIQTRAFPPSDYEVALNYLEIFEAGARDALLRAVASCKLNLAGGKTLADVTRAKGLRDAEAIDWVIAEPVAGLRTKLVGRPASQIR